MSLTALVDQIPLTSVADISVSRHGAAVLLIWRVEDETARLADLLQHAQRLGRIGGFEENLVTGGITWNAQLYALHGLPATAPPVRLRELPGYAHPDDSAALDRFLRAVLRYRRPASVNLRLRRPDGITRHIRVVAEPVLDADQRLHAVRGAYQDISAQHWTEVALAATRDQLAHTEAESAERNRLALQLQHAIMPPPCRPSRHPACASPSATGPPRPSRSSAVTGTTPWSCPPGWSCSPWATSPDTVSRRPPAWSSCATRCAASP